MRIVRFVLSVAFTFGVLIALFLASTILNRALGADSIVELRRMEVEYHNFFDGGRDPLVTQNPNVPNRELGREVNLLVDTDILDYFYWNNRVLSKTDRDAELHRYGQFRYVAWEYRVGVRLTSNINLEYKHLSQHVLDTQLPNRFPVQDSIGINIILYSKPKPRESLF